MKLTFDTARKTLYLNNKHFCFAEVKNERKGIPAGKGAVRSEFSQNHGQELLYAEHAGWIGASRECDIVLGTVHRRTDLIPSEDRLDRLLDLVLSAEELGTPVTLEVV